MDPAGWGLFIIVLLIVLFGSRSTALMGMMAGVLFLSQGLSLDIFGLNMFAMRLLGLAGFARVILRKEFRSGDVNQLDQLLLLTYGYVTAVFLVRTWLGYGTSEQVTVITSTAKFGQFVDITLCYFAFRGLIPSTEEWVAFLRRSILLLIPFVTIVTIERVTGRNPFEIVGGPTAIWIDGDRIRCFGSFLHPSLLGSFGASFLLLYLGLAFIPKHRLHGVAGALLCGAVVLFSGSGGPLTMTAVALIGWLLWPLRENMAAVRLGMIGGIVLLALVMKAPLWYLPMKFSSLFGGGGWHRSFLMEQGLKDMEHWWIAGMPLDFTRDWFPYLVEGAADMTNLYLAFGVDGGLLAIVFLLLFLVGCFRSLGRAMASIRRPADPVPAEIVLWSLGVVLVAHMVNFLAIYYFDQTYAIWMMHLAAIASLSQETSMTNARSMDASHTTSPSPRPARKFTRQRTM